jgi:CBS domain-containing protein
MELNEFITTKIETIDSDHSVYDAIERMVDRRIRSLVVAFSGKQTEHGVITARDIVFKVLAKGLEPKEVKVSEIASRPLLCVGSDVSLDEMASSMLEANVARVFVCDNGEITGVFSLMDLMAATVVRKARGNGLS